MFTTVDKALAALLGSVLTILPLYVPALAFLADASVQSAITAAFVPLLVYLIPNKQ